MIAAIERPRISTKRLTLRTLTLADAPRLARLANDFEVVRTTGGMPFPYTEENARASVRRAEAADPEREQFFVIDLAGEGPIGTLAFYATGEVGPEVGYWLGRPYWGRGLGSEALGAAMGWARDAWKKRCVVACHHVGNDVSGQMLIRAGFLYTGKVELRPCRARNETIDCRWMVWLP